MSSSQMKVDHYPGLDIILSAHVDQVPVNRIANKAGKVPFARVIFRRFRKASNRVPLVRRAQQSLTSSMHIRWHFLLTCGVVVLSQKNKTVLGVKATESSEPSVTAIPKEKFQVAAYGDPASAHGYPTLKPPTSNTCSRQTVTITNGGTSGCPRPSTITKRLTLTSRYVTTSISTSKFTTTCTEYITVTNTKKVTTTETKTDVSTITRPGVNITTTVPGQNTITKYTTYTTTFRTISLVPTTQTSFQPTTEISLVTTLVPTTVEVTEIIRTTDFSITTTTYTSVTTSVTTEYVPTTIILSGMTSISTQTVVATVTETLTLTDTISLTQTVEISIPGPTQTLLETTTEVSFSISTQLSTLTLPPVVIVTTTTLPASTQVITTELPASTIVSTVTSTSTLPLVTLTTTSVAPPETIISTTTQPGQMVTTTLQVPGSASIITTQLPPSTILSTITLPPVTSTITTQVPVTTSESTLLSTLTLPASTVVTTITLLPITSVTTLTLPGSVSISTALITKTVIITQVLPTTTPPTLTPSPSSTSSASISCTSDCQIDVTATQLGYPGVVVVSTVKVPVVTLFITTNPDGIPVSSSLFTSVIPPDPTLTWDYSGITLTYPTTYAVYETFSHISVEPVGTVCLGSTLTLALPSPTNYEPLIVVYDQIPNPDFVAPTVVEYLNGLATVTEQLGSTIGTGACDPNAKATDKTSTSSRVTTMFKTRGTVGTLTKFVAQADELPTSTGAVSVVVPFSSAAQRISSTLLPPPSTAVMSRISTSPGPSSSSSAPLLSSLASTRSTTSAINRTSSALFSSTNSFNFTAGAVVPTGHIVGMLLGVAGLGLGLF
ncbi:hypothetical protein IAQ61_005396 [Plenodomus lingam]|uniref:uncharacterized protein n=1 Tax=Leptosphaeria maculans TaxID=5022 RepID=UPI00331C914F|nr:hypothetical protein IAQ61_005396 [Plenodomus lingam]